MVVADEMDADFDRVRVVQALADERYGDQNTDGSHSVRDFFEPMRKVGRHGPVHAGGGGGQGLGRPRPASARAAQHFVHHRASGRQLGYGELAERAAAVARPRSRDPEAQDPRPSGATSARAASSWTSPTSSPGRAVFGIDARMDGMLHASIERPPVVGGKPTSFDKEAALKVAGVRHVVELDGAGLSQGFKPLGGVAVVADHTWARAAGAQGPEGDLGPGARRRPRLGRVSQGAGDQGHRSRPRSCATGATWTRRSARRPSGSRPSTTRRTSPTAPSSRRPPWPRCATEAARSGPAPRTPWARRKEVATALGPPGREGHAPRDPPGRRLRPQVEARFHPRGGAPLAEGRPAGQGDLDAGGRDPARVLPLRERAAPRSGPGRGGQRRRLATPHRLPHHRLHLRRQGRVPAELGAGPGLLRPALRRAQPAPRERPHRPPRPHRVAALGGEHLPRLRHRLLRGRAGPRRGRRSQGLPPEADRRAPARRPEGRAAPTTRTTTPRSRTIPSTRGACAT